MYQAQVNELKFDIERINKEIGNVKNKWFGLMRDNRNRPLDEVQEQPMEDEMDVQAVY